MTPGEQTASLGREVKHKVLTDLDLAKRTIRNGT
jgi:hypothetical protein